ncbi:MAG: fimbria/pilus periplasmic chaperone [Alphaproteobacteria bacterium]
MKSFFWSRSGLLFFFLIFITVSTHAGAYEVRPMILNMIAGRSGEDETITISNTTDRAIALETVVQKRTKLEDGTEELSPADEDFIILPPQVLIEPGKKENISVRWVGGDIGNMKSYYITIRQLPIDSTPQDNLQGIQLLINFSVAAYISPDSGIAGK